VSDTVSAGPKVARLGTLFSLLTILAAFGTGAIFGLWEDKVKDHLKSEAAAVKDTVYKGDEALMKKVTDKSWVYCKRAHMHAAGLGAISLALIVYLGAVGTNCLFRFFGSLCVGVGALGYSVFWALAGLTAPRLGSTGAAKEELFYLAQGAAGACLVGLLFAFLAFLGSLAGGCCRRDEG